MRISIPLRSVACRLTRARSPCSPKTHTADDEIVADSREKEGSLSYVNDTEIGAEGSDMYTYSEIESLSLESSHGISARFQNRARPRRHVECICAHSSRRAINGKFRIGDSYGGFSQPKCCAFPVSRVSSFSSFP